MNLMILKNKLKKKKLLHKQSKMDGEQASLTSWEEKYEEVND